MRSSQGEVRGTGLARSPGTGVLKRAGKLGQDMGGVGRPCDEWRLGAWDHRRHQMPGESRGPVGSPLESREGPFTSGCWPPGL